MKVTISIEVEKLLQEIENNSKLKNDPLFIAGQKYAELRVDEKENILTWGNAAVNDLIFSLLMLSKIDIAQVLGLYADTIEHKLKQKQSLISDLASSLILYRKGVFKETQDAERADEAIKRTDMFNY